MIDVTSLGPFPPALVPPPPPRTLEEALDRLAYGDRGVIDRAAHLAFIREHIASAVAEERLKAETGAQLAIDAMRETLEQQAADAHGAEGRAPMTPRDRDRDHAVWTAAYVAAFWQACPVMTELRTPDATASACVFATSFADAAVLALHPEPAECGAVDRVDRTDTRRHPGGLEISRWANEQASTQQTPASRLAALEAAERAYLLAAGWTQRKLDGAWIDPEEAKRGRTPIPYTLAGALDTQRARDAA